MKNLKIVDCDFNQVYVVYQNGNVLKYFNSNKKPALRYAERLASKGDYVELCYFYNPDKYILLKYWN